jgi:hypothetical protein
MVLSLRGEKTIIDIVMSSLGAVMIEKGKR